MNKFTFFSKPSFQSSFSTDAGIAAGISYLRFQYYVQILVKSNSKFYSHYVLMNEKTLRIMA